MEQKYVFIIGRYVIYLYRNKEGIDGYITHKKSQNQKVYRLKETGEIERYDDEKFNKCEKAGSDNFVKLLMREKIGTANRTPIEALNQILLAVIDDLLANKELTWFPTNQCEYNTRSKKLNLNYGDFNIGFSLPTMENDWNPRTDILKEISSVQHLLIEQETENEIDNYEIKEPVSPKEEQVIPPKKQSRKIPKKKSDKPEIVVTKLTTNIPKVAINEEANKFIAKNSRQLSGQTKTKKVY